MQEESEKKKKGRKEKRGIPTLSRLEIHSFIIL